MHLRKWPLTKVHIGARVLKTALAIVISIYVANFLDLTPTLAAMGAIFAVKPSVYRSYLNLLEQAVANMIGAMVAVILVLLFGPEHTLLIGFGAIFTIWFTSRWKSEDYVGTALVTMLVIMEAQGGNLFLFAAERYTSIMLGVIAAFAINILVLPPRYELKFFENLLDYNRTILSWIGKKTQPDMKVVIHHKDFDQIRKKLVKVEYLYHLFSEDRNFNMDRPIRRKRKLVLYRAMISTSQRAYNVLRKYHALETQLHMMPVEFQEEVVRQIKILVEHHQNFHQNFRKTNDCHKVFESTNLSELISLLGQLRDIKHQDSITLLHMTALTSAMFEYGEHLQHLHVLYESFYNFHDEEKTDASSN